MSVSNTSEQWWDERILITAKTYPIPHAKHHETVCTAGINENGEWRRLWPIPFRHLSGPQQFRKYEWIEARIRKQGSDRRKESHVVDPDHLRATGEVVGPERNWQRRRDLILRWQAASLEELSARYEEDLTSMGVFRPREFGGLKITWRDKPHWSRELQNKTEQGILWASVPSLRPLPFQLHLEYRCDSPRCPGHEQSIMDWEMGARYWTEFERNPDEQVAAEATQKAFSEFFTAGFDTWLHVGTLGPVWKSWVIIGLLRPKAAAQTSLFEYV